MDGRLRRLAGAAAALCFFATSVGAGPAAPQTSAPPALRQAMAFLKAANADEATFQTLRVEAEREFAGGRADP